MSKTHSGHVPIQAISIPTRAVEPSIPKATQVTESVRGGGKKMRFRNTEHNNMHQQTTESFEEMKMRDRSKSPLRRLLRTLSRSPLRRRRTKKNEGEKHVVVENDPTPEYLVDQPVSPNHGDGVSSLGTADYTQNFEYMVDPLGSIRSSNNSQARLGIRPSGISSRSISSSTASRSESLYDEENSSFNSWRESRDADSLATGSKDSRGSRHERPRPVMINKRRIKHQERPTTSGRSQGLPSVREDGSSTTDGVAKSDDKEDLLDETKRKERTKSKTIRKVGKSQVVWTKYPASSEQKQSSSVPKVQSVSTSSMCSEASLSTRVLLLLLHPVSKFFELIQLVFTPETSTVGDLLDSIPSQATEVKLAEQHYIGLVRAAKHAESWTERLQPASQAFVKNHTIPPAGIVPGDVLVAIPYGYTRRHVIRLGLQILESPRIKSLLVDKFRAEMNVPRTITTSPTTQPPTPEREAKIERDLKAVAESPDPRSAMIKLLANEESESSVGSKKNGVRRGVFRQKTPPPAEFWQKSRPEASIEDSQNAVHEEKAVVEPVSSLSIMAPDSIDKADSSSREEPSNSEDDPTPVDSITGPSGASTFRSSSLPTEDGKHQEVKPVSSMSLLASVSVEREDSSSSEDISNSAIDPAILVSSFLPESSPTADPSPGNVHEGVVEVEIPVPPEVDSSFSTDAIAEAECTDAAKEISANIEAHNYDSRSSDTGISPVRQRIQELEEKIAVCPGVPVPRVGLHDFSHSEYESDDGSEDLPELVETAHADERYDSEDSAERGENHESDESPITCPEQSKENEEEGLDLTTSESANIEEHREIIREASARVESLPAPPPPTLEMFIKGQSPSIGDDDDATVVTHNTRRAPLALAGNYEEGSVDTSYSLWSHSVDSSLVSRFSLISHSSRSFMTEEEVRLAEARVKTRQRRRQKAKLARSLRKLGISAFLLMAGLYWIDSRRNRESGDNIAVSVNRPLGVLGILQFVVAMCLLMKVQLLWKCSGDMKSKTCPFLKAVNVFIEGLKEKQP